LTITNGFDPDDFTHVHSGVTQHDEQFTLAYVGRFDLSQTPETWFSALQKFVEEIGPDCDRFVLRIAGHVNRTAQAKLTATGVRCEIQGYLPHREAISAMCQADALLLCSPSGPNGDTIIPAKLFEYLATGRPILTMGPTGSICELMVQAARAGVSANFEQASIVSALHEVFDAWRSGMPMEGASRDSIADFSRVGLTGTLANLFDQMAVARPERSLSRGELVAACDP
jgi:glycosyltransferase involved in cell wall biosynthesis